MKKIIVLITLAFIGLSTANAQVGIGTTDPDASAKLEVNSPNNDKGFLPPRMSTTDRDNIAGPTAGLVIYNTTTNTLQFSDGTDWVDLADNSTTAVSGTEPAGNGDVGIGTATPNVNAVLDVESTTQGFLPPRMNDAQRNAISSPAEGLTIYNTSNGCLEFWNNAFWVSACDGTTQPGPTSVCGDQNFIPPYLPADQTEVVPVTSPTGEVWMDRNLGAYTADRTPPSSDGGTDCYAYGNLYQWGRDNDGHESRLLDCTTGDCFDAGGVNSSLPATAADVTDPTWAGKFIFNMSSSPGDWHQSPDQTLWTGAPAGGPNNPCPTGYRVPTTAEWQAEIDSWTPTDREGAINSPLKLPVAGFRSFSNGDLSNCFFVSNPNGTKYDCGLYWTSEFPFSNTRRLIFGSSSASLGTSLRANGYSVRCIKD